MIIKSKSDGYVIEIVRFNGTTYEQKWGFGEFNVEFVSENHSGEIRCEVDSMMRVTDDLGIRPQVNVLDDSEDGFRLNYETIVYYIVGGYD